LTAPRRKMSAIEDIFARIGWAAICLPSAEADLLVVEQRIGRKLPAAFREFYSIEDARALLKYYSNSDRPLSVAELAEPMSPRWDNYDPVDDKVLPFMIEKPGGVRLGSPPGWRGRPVSCCRSGFRNTAALATLCGVLQRLARIPSRQFPGSEIVMVRGPSSGTDRQYHAPSASAFRGRSANARLARRDELSVLQ